MPVFVFYCRTYMYLPEKQQKEGDIPYPSVALIA